MVVLNMFGKIKPICISEKLKLYISNLPKEENNNWNEYLVEEIKEAFAVDKITCERLMIKSENSPTNLHEILLPESALPSSATDDERIQEIADNMVCIYFDYNYDDMPLGDWEENPFDGRFCEEDYAELVVDFLNYIAADDSSFVPQWIFSSNYDDINPYYRLFWDGGELEQGIDYLIKFGNTIDLFLRDKNDYLQLDYLMRAIHKDNEYNVYHLFKAYSLCQLFLENEYEAELDWKLPRFIDDKYSEEQKRIISTLLRKMRNKIAHGDFVAFEKLIEEFAQKIMDGRFCFDYSEYSRKNWTTIHACCIIDKCVKEMILMMLEDYEALDKIKKMKIKPEIMKGKKE